MIKYIYMRDFRNYKEASVPFSPHINLIWGGNAQGKTNLLEALYLFMTGRSFRTPRLAELIRFGASAFYLEMLFEKNGIEQTLKFSFDGTLRKIIYNATPLTTVSSLIGILGGVMLSPEDSALIKGGPSIRRQFLDLLLSQANPLYLHHLCRYLRAMKQRNHLLKKREFETAPIWEEQMAASAAFLTMRRVQTAAELEHLSQSETLASEELKLVYRSGALSSGHKENSQLSSFFLKQFAKHRAKEAELGMTLSGPHRDDLSILLHSKDTRQFASEGQQRSCVATLKLAQWKWLNTLADQTPILCIDDMGVSFDPAREEELYKKIGNLGQVFITSARPGPLSCYSIRIESGNAVF